jgi:hypothetical protein
LLLGIIFLDIVDAATGLLSMFAFTSTSSEMLSMMIVAQPLWTSIGVVILAFANTTNTSSYSDELFKLI